jgi:hypothetical protein
LQGFLSDEDATAELKEMYQIAETWGRVRMLSRAEAESTLEPKWLEAYNRFFTKFDDDMTRMQEYAEKVAIQIEPPRVQKKTKGQMKRDAWAKVQARMAARAAAAQPRSKKAQEA